MVLDREAFLLACLDYYVANCLFVPVCRWLNLKHTQFAVHISIFELDLWERVCLYLLIVLLGSAVVYGAARQVANTIALVGWIGKKLMTWYRPYVPSSVS